MPDLATLGWDEAWDAAFEPHREAGLVPGRIAIPHRVAFDVLTEAGDVRALLPGRARRNADPSELPVVGDWIALELGDAPRIRAVLPRRTKFSRRAAHGAGAEVAREQVIAANVDVVFVTMSLADPLGPRVVERYLALAWESGARPVVLLTKADLERDPPGGESEIAALGRDVPVLAISARTGLGLDAVREHLPRGATGALLGPSGVGKSTLVNALAGEDLLATGSVADDGSGRHTTTRRQLVLLPEGGLLVDNPGMREVHLWLAGEGLDDAFPEIADLASNCRFSDCRHKSEPGCAVQEALADGRLDPARWQGYLDLRRELDELEERLERRERSRGRGRNPDTNP